MVSKDLKQRELEKERFTVVCPRCRQNLKTGHFTLLESLSKDDGYGNENVSPKYNLALSQVFRDYSVLFTLYNTGELSCNWMGTNGFKVKIENDCFIVICSRCRQNLKFGDFTLLHVWCSTAEKCTEIRIARAARVFFFF